MLSVLQIMESQDVNQRRDAKQINNFEDIQVQDSLSCNS